MKKIISLLLSALMLFMLFGCTSEVAKDASSAGAEALGVYGEGYDFHVYYAKTPEYFYAFTTRDGGPADRASVLERIKLDDFNQRETIPIQFPEKYDRHEILGLGYRSVISGITSKWLFVSISVEFNNSLTDTQLPEYLLYKISHDGKEQELLGASGWHGAMLNPAGNSLCYMNQMEDKTTIESYDLLTNEKKIIFDEPSTGDFHRWSRTEDGNAALLTIGEFSAVGTCVVIDDENNAIKTEAEDLKLMEEFPYSKTPANETERQLSHNENVFTFSSHDQWVYYVEYEQASHSQHLYRVKADGSDKKKLRTKTHIDFLLTIGNKLYALARYETGDTGGMAEDRVELHQLDGDGKAISTVKIGFSNENSGISMYEFNGKILMYEVVIYGGLNFAALYDPVTGICFQ